MMTKANTYTCITSVTGTSLCAPLFIGGKFRHRLPIYLLVTHKVLCLDDVMWYIKYCLMRRGLHRSTFP